jgi:curved DNA-binding protein
VSAVARDYYEVLGVPRTAGADELQQAYRRLARRYHPDVNKEPSAADRFKEINEAYHVLADPKARARYDRFGENFRQVPEDYDERAGAAAGFNAGGGRGRRVRVSGADVTGIDIDDLLNGMFGGRGGYGPIPGADQEAVLDLSVEEAYRGGRRTFTLPGQDGSRRIDVDIPRGVVDGQRIRLAGQGGTGGRGASDGDLYLVVRIAPDARFRLDGRDVYTDLPVTPWEAALGATVPVPAPGGEAKVKVPPGSSSGRRLRLRGEGMPNPRGRPGDLYAEVRITVPDRLTDRERELFEQLAAASTFDPRAPRRKRATSSRRRS